MIEQLGPAYALLTALSWATAVIYFRKSGEGIGPVGLNVLKNLVGLVLLGVTAAVVTTRLPVGNDALALMASGAVGIGIADSLFFVSLNKLGASRTAVIGCLYSPLIVLFSYIILDERLSLLDLGGAVLIVSGVSLTAVGGGAETISRRDLVGGIAAGIAAEAFMGLAIVAVKPILEREEVVGATLERMIGGIAILTLLVMSHRPSRREVVAALKPQSAWRVAIPGALIGTYIALLFWIAGFKYNDASIAALLNQTATIFIVILAAIFLGEPLTKRSTTAVAMAVGGSVLVLV